MPKIEFNHSDRENLEIPTTEEISHMARKQLMDTAVVFSYALQHGSGSASRLAIPFARCIAQLVQGGEKDAVKLVNDLEEQGRDKQDEYGTVNVVW